MPRRPATATGTTVWERPAPAVRRQPPAVTREQITDTAIALADKHGLEAVTMRRLGSELDVAPTSLYWYFSTKDELHELMADAIIGRIALPPETSGSWRADLQSIAWATLAEARRHPWFALLFFQEVPGPSTLRYGARALASFAGLDPAFALVYLAAVNNYVLGFALRAAQRSKRPVAVQPPPPSPSEAVSAEQLIARSRLTDDKSFSRGLNCLLNGIQSDIDRESSRP